MLLSVLLLDARSGVALGRSSRRAKDGGVDAILDEIRPMLEELYSGKSGSSTLSTSSQGVIVGARVDADIAGAINASPGSVPLAPGLTFEWSGRWVGIATTVFLMRVPALRVEGRFFPTDTRVRPWIALGATGFIDLDVMLHGSVGLATRLGPLNVAIDGGVEWSPIVKPEVTRLAALVGLRVGYQF